MSWFRREPQTFLLPDKQERVYTIFPKNAPPMRVKSSINFIDVWRDAVARKNKLTEFYDETGVLCAVFATDCISHIIQGGIVPEEKQG